MKQEIIDFVMFTLPFHWIHGWKVESAKEFCKLIFDGEGIDYQEEDLNKKYTYGTGNMEAIEIVKRYADKYMEIYKTSDLEKYQEMYKVSSICDQLLNFSRSIDDIFSGKYEEGKPVQEITIKKGESIRFSNGAGSNLTPEELEHLMKATFNEEQEEKPFTIHFNKSVPENVKEEVMKRVSSIFEEVSAEMSGKVK